MTAGLWSLLHLNDRLYAHLEQLGRRLAAGLTEAAQAAGATVSINRVGSLLTVFFTDQPVVNYDTAKTSDTTAYGRFFQAMLAACIYLPPSQFEAWFLSGAHTTAHIDQAIKASRRAFRTTTS